MFLYTRRCAARSLGPEITSALKALGFDRRTAPTAGTTAIRAAEAWAPTPAEVRQRYRELAQRHHPDLSSGDSQRMQDINAAYELLLSSGALRQDPSTETSGAEASPRPRASRQGGAHRTPSFREQRQERRREQRRRAMPADFADGDDLSWALKSSLEWRAMVSTLDDLSAAELNNPANHPLSHSKFFSLEEDATIYRELRSGATVPQVARTLGKPATFIEKRLHNAQFKLRVRHLLQSERRTTAKTASPTATLNLRSTAPPSGPNTAARVLRRSPTTSGLHPAATRKAAWEPTLPRWEDQRYYPDLTLEEKAQLHGFGFALDDPPEAESAGPLAAEGSTMGRSYRNYQRLHGGKGGIR